MSEPATSLEKSFREACGRGAVAGAEVDAHQLDMLRDEQGNLPANVFQLARAGKAVGPGRPKGATNKRNQKLAQLICERSGDPVLFMADVYAMPLDQLVELLKIADNVEQQDRMLYQLAAGVQAQVEALIAKTTLTREDQRKLDGLVDKLSDIAKVLRNKPGTLAAQALALQMSAAKAVAEYVHGKQPVSVHVDGKADMVLLVPGLNAPIDEASGDLAKLVGKHGIEAIDFENMKILPNLSGDEEGEPDE